MLSYWETRIPSDMCSPTWETRIPSDMCSLTWETRTPSDMFSPTQEMHICCDVCIVLIMEEMIKTTSLTSFFYRPLFYGLVQQFLAGENLKVGFF